MQNSKELEAVKRRIRALVEKTPQNGATEAEAISAMEKVGELLETFNLNMSEVLIYQEAIAHEIIDTGSKHRGVLFDIIVGLAEMTETKVWWHRRRGNNILVHIFGLENDVQMAKYLAEIIVKAGDTALALFKESSYYRNYGGHRRPLSTSFLNAFGDRMCVRLIEISNVLKQEADRANAYHAEQNKNFMLGMSDEAAAAAAKLTTGTALIRQAKSTRIEKEFDERLGIKLINKNIYRRFSNSTATANGRNAANNVNLSRPISSGGKKSVAFLT